MLAPVRAVGVIAAAMTSLSRKRRIIHSEADFQHVLASEAQVANPTASVRLEKRDATNPSVQFDLVHRAGRRRDTRRTGSYHGR